MAYRDTIGISGADYRTLAEYGLDCDDCMDGAEFRNEMPDDSGSGMGYGEWFATIENHVAPDGRTYHVLVTGTFANDHSPGASHYTFFGLYPTDEPDACAQFNADVAEWEAKPETDPDYEPETDDEDSADIGADSIPDGWDEV